MWRTYSPKALKLSLVASVYLASLTLASAFQVQSSTQPLPPSSYKLIAVTVSGSKRFTSEEVAAASGLPMGTVAHEDDFKKAARQLGDSGAFANIGYTFSYSSAGTRLQFQVTDADRFVPVHFTDFVWFPEDDLRKKLHDRLPLFSGELPSTGRLADEVSDILQALLVQNNVPGHVEYHRVADKSDQLQSVDYYVAGVSIRIHGLDFPGAGPEELSLLKASGEKLIDREYSSEYMANFVQRSVLAIFREHGYLQAACAPPKVTVVHSESPAQDLNRQLRTYVDVTFPLTPGLQYKVSHWEWSGNKEFSSETFQPLLHMKAGQVADSIQLHEDLRAVQELYGSHGFVTATIKAEAKMEDDGTVSYRLEVDEGPVYHMGELEFRGIDNNLTAHLRAAWKLHPGDIYDASYLKEFLPQALKLLPANLDWVVDPHVTAIAQNRTVDVDLQYTAKAPQP